MAYVPTVWQDGVTPVNATNLNKIETGLDGQDDRIVVLESRPATPAVVNGQWLKGVGGVPVWTAITQADVANLTTDLAAKADAAATSSALAGKEATANRGVANGYAPLGSDSKVPTANLPAVVSDALKEDKANKGVASGYAPLDATGKVPAANLPAAAPVTQTRQYPLKLTAPRSQSLAGNSFWTVAQMSIYDFAHWQFVKDVDGRVAGQIMIPKTVAATPNAKIVLVITAAGTGISRFYCLYQSQPTEGGTINTGFTTATAVDTNISVAYGTKRVTLPIGAPAVDQLLIFEIVHDGTHANDTIAVNTMLVEAYLEIDA